MPKPPTKGQIFECRVARLLHHEGAFVRRAVDLQMQFGEAFTVTDVDVLALTLSGSLQPQVSIVECKTTESKGSPSHGDRLLWVTGVKQLVPGASSHALATTKEASDHVRRLGQQLGAEILDARDIAHRERVLGLAVDDLSGPHDPSLLALEESAFRAIKNDPELRRVWSFVRSEFWFAESTYGLKRTFGALRLLDRRWHQDLPSVEANAVRWLAQETVAAALVAIVALAGQAYRQPPEVFDRFLSTRLSEGVASHEVLDQLSSELDRYLMAILREAGADPSRQLDHLGALKPKLPNYAEPLVEVLHRVADSPHEAAHLTRQYDEMLAAVRGSAVPARHALADSGSRNRLMKTISLFLSKQIQIPDEFVEALNTAPVTAGPSTPTVQPPPKLASESTGQSTHTRAPSLFSAESPGLPPTEDKRSEPAPEAAFPAIVPTGFFGLFSTSGGSSSDVPLDALWIEMINRSDAEVELISGNGDATRLGRFSTEYSTVLEPGVRSRVEFSLRVPEKNGGSVPTIRVVDIDLALRIAGTTTREVSVRAEGLVRR